MLKLASLCLALFLALSVVAFHNDVHSQSQRPPASRYVADQILVQLKDEAVASIRADRVADEVLPASGATAEALSSASGARTHLIHLNRGISVEEALRRAASDPRVEYAEPDYILRAADTIPNDPDFGQLWGLLNPFCSPCADGQTSADIGATKAWDITTGSEDVVVAVIDTGVDLAHPDLAPNAWVNPGEIPGNGIDDEGNGFVDDVNGWNFLGNNNQTFTSAVEDRHGTHVAGIIGAAGNNGIGVTGVAWRVKIMALKFLGGPNIDGTTSNSIRAINYTIGERTRGINVRVINASWAAPDPSQALHDAIAAAGQAGILFVGAAGNDSHDADQIPSYPAVYSAGLDSQLAVAATTSADFLAEFSNYGHETISVAAPGDLILSTLPNGTYGQLSGTSMATPYVSGIAALLWSHEPALTPAQVKQRIISTSKPTPPLASRIASSGRANAYNALVNRIEPLGKPQISQVTFAKKSMTVDGLGFVSGSSFVTANGRALPNIAYDPSYQLASGALTRLTATMSKVKLRRIFPGGVTVNVTVVNPTTGDQSQAFPTARF